MTVRKALWKIYIHELLYPLRYSSLVNHSSSCYEGCQGHKCFRIHFRQVVCVSVSGGLQSLFWGRPFFYCACGVGESIFGITRFCHLVALTNSRGFRCHSKVHPLTGREKWLKVDVEDEIHDICISFFKLSI